MNGSMITDSPIGAVLFIIGSVVTVMALVCVIIQIYKNHISDRSMCREIYGTDKPAKHKSVPKKLKALEERFRELDIPPVYSFTGNCCCEHFTITAKREFIFYVCCHTVGGETLDKKLFLNSEKARRYSRFAADAGMIPIAPHLLFPQFLSEETERELAIFMDLVLLGKCEQLWVFGGEVSDGMRREIGKAKQKNMTIRYFTEDMEETECR